MKSNRRVVKIFLPLLFAALTSSMWLWQPITVAAANKDAATNDATANKDAAATTTAAQTAQSKSATHMRKGMSMHVPDWSKMPTGVATTNTSGTTVTPLDPNTIPKFVNQLTRPATFVPSGTKFDRQLGRDIPLYQVTENTI